MQEQGLFPIWTYRARYHSITDGDTLRLDIDLGFYIRAVHPIRLAGINTPEIYRGTDEEKEAGFAAREYVREWMQEQPGWDEHLGEMSGIRRGGWVFELETEANKQSFNRYIGRLYRLMDGHCLNDDLVESGHAVSVD